MLTKKYFSISEICNICNLPQHKLRYIEKKDNNIALIKIRGRRYYSLENLEYLLKNYSTVDKTINQAIEKHQTVINSNKQDQIIIKIDLLIKKFSNLLQVV